MKISKITIHNFRSIKHESFDLKNYTLLIGENNAGKSNIFRAIRVFYENGLKFNQSLDFPKFKTDDSESWIEIEYETTEDEQKSLKNEYQNSDRILKVRKILKTNDTTLKKLVKANQSNIFGYEQGVLATNYFYGAKNISQTKLGSIIFIPELSKIDDSLKMSGPSPLREMINFVVKKAVENSATYKSLTDAFEDFNKKFRKETSKDEFSIENLEKDINSEVKHWDIEFGLNINPIKSKDIVKSLVSHEIKDKILNDQTVNIDSFGQGLQRHLIYTLLKLSAKYSEIKQPIKKEFSPDFTLILFEEPEAFLHPSQQERMNVNLYKLAQNHNQQIIITTHSPIFSSKNIESLPSLVKVKKGVETQLFQLSSNDISDLLDENSSMFRYFFNMLSDENVSNNLKSNIRNKGLAKEDDNEELKLEQEKFKYSLWLDSERTSLLFARHVLICEGASEKVFLDYLINNQWDDFKDKQLYILDSLGKFNIHRYMNLFGYLGIDHSVLMDSDNNQVQELINNFINDNRNDFTLKIHLFPDDLESYLGISAPKRKDLKPLNIMHKYSKGEIHDDKIKELRNLVNDLITN